MGDTGIFATTAEVQRKVGANASSTSNTEDYINDFISQAESHINVETTFNWSDVYSTLNVDVKGILKKAASALAAIDVINYDMSSFSRLLEVQTRVSILKDQADECIKILKEKDTAQIFMEEA